MVSTATARKRAPLNGGAAKADGAGAPQIVSLRTAAEHGPADRVDLFEIDGVMYSITKPKTNIGLRYLHLARTQGPEIAIDYMLETLLGAEGYEALMNFDDLTEGDLKNIIEIASRVMAGPVEDPKGKR